MAASLLTIAAPAMAQAETPTMTADGSVSVVMPCQQPEDATNDTDFLEGWLCLDENAMFVMIVSTGPQGAAYQPFTSDFDALVADVSDDISTGNVDESMVDGRRTLVASMNEGGTNGSMRAVQIAPDRVAYAITMSNPDAPEALKASIRERGMAFLDSMEIHQ
ncbi:hypothetical protein [Aurantiacibacter sediminis]|uniref:Uncharacterized protein n=1 Tax=Aurantiacibacter sediminis TaxID=2793064 RepID=A0ABS0N4T5_9SPHN|nr:hypothetical protein [Aurantiacibacter sediminis]MBH5322736.1 hypothetical protein [Aurantiacibacter sediminis]